MISAAPLSGAQQISSPLFDSYAAQLADDGYLTVNESESTLGWDAYFSALEQAGYGDLPGLLGCPEGTRADIVLSSRHALTDPNFSIFVSGWQHQGQTAFLPDQIGAVITYGGRSELMRPAQWRLMSEVVAFSRRTSEQRTDGYQRQAWGAIRRLAVQARANLSDFLSKSIVVTPERLEIKLRKSDVVTTDRVVEIEPSFAGAPEGWMERFDSAPAVLDHYDFNVGEGVCHVAISPKVRTVLREIKRLPNRRVAGARAEALILNPFATLGEDAQEVIDEAQFESAREVAGLRYERFVPQFERDSNGYPLKVGVLVETASSDGPINSESLWLDDAELKEFVAALERNITAGHQLLAWKGFDFELQGDAQRHLDALQSALEQREKPAVVVSYSSVHDLSSYSSRIAAIGIEKPYCSPYIAKKDEEKGWFPENVAPFVNIEDSSGRSTGIPIDQGRLSDLERAIRDAEVAGQGDCVVPWLPKPIPTGEAKGIVDTFRRVFEDVVSGTFDPKPSGSREPRAASKTLILRANIQTVDYEEQRREELLRVPKEPELPKALLPSTKLKPHQLDGLAWLQHLYNCRADHEVRGAVLADDMGLGKTLQLLALVAWLTETQSGPPVLVVAPVALLENWIEEIGKFFAPGSLPTLTAYGSELAPLRVPKSAIDARLLSEDGLVKFLRPNWVGNARIVLTTYETLRDFEFSFASERWSVMVCDEAQKIKNPAAMVTRAAKKQNVQFKIACTGTPVENTLADLWCLFDFVQPGLLGALNDFGQKYRRPIEAEGDPEAEARVQELRVRIAPQVLRRTKTEVAKDLPLKITNQDCLCLPLSAVQRALYSKAVEDFRRRAEPGVASPFKNHLGLLQYLRLICTDPRRHGLGTFVPEPMADYRLKSPKLDWLLKQLEIIRERREKVIVFCEFRNIQRLLQHYIAESIGYRADIINGDTSASSSSDVSRQKRLKVFQARPGFGVIILSPLAVGFGVNIQAANHVVHFTRTWNPAKEDQATDRAYRIGQERDVHVYYPVVVADDFPTFDVKLDQLLTRKRELASDMLNGAGDVGPADFNIADVVPRADRSGLDERVDIAMAQQMDWKFFEALVELLWTRRGFTCYGTPVSGDNGVDVVAIKGKHGQLIQVKSSGAGLALGWDAVKEVVAGAAFYEERHVGIQFDRVCITNQTFNAQARDNAALNDVVLLEHQELQQLLDEFEINMLDVERVLYPDWD